jgi:hypothetical protein
VARARPLVASGESRVSSVRNRSRERYPTAICCNCAVSADRASSYKRCSGSYHLATVQIRRPILGLAQSANQSDESGPVLRGLLRHCKPLEHINVPYARLRFCPRFWLPCSAGYPAVAAVSETQLLGPSGYRTTAARSRLTLIKKL